MGKPEPNKTCFVIAVAGPSNSDVRRRSERVFKYIIKPAAEAYGYTCVRADPAAKPGLVTPDTIYHLVNDPLVIVDLTDYHPGMFYQLGIRHMVRKPVAHVVRKEQALPLELADVQTIPYDLSLEGAEACKEELLDFIDYVERNPDDVENPISANVELRALRRSDNPVERTHAQIVAMLRRLNAKIDTLTHGSEKPELDFTGFAEVWVDLKALEDMLDVAEEELLSASQIMRARKLVQKVQRTLGATLATLAEPAYVRWEDQLWRREQGDAEALGKALANLYKVTTQPLEPLDPALIEAALARNNEQGAT